jgi:hypothetical protein
VVFSSVNDPWIPIKEPRFVHEKFGTEHHEFINMGTFWRRLLQSRVYRTYARTQEKVEDKAYLKLLIGIGALTKDSLCIAMQHPVYYTMKHHLFACQECA